MEILIHKPGQVSGKHQLPRYYAPRDTAEKVQALVRILESELAKRSFTAEDGRGGELAQQFSSLRERNPRSYGAQDLPPLLELLGLVQERIRQEYSNLGLPGARIVLETCEAEPLWS